jgi:GTP-binding protein
MKPVIAIVGRPNVGKSTLFNRLTRSRDALVADFPGLTRDRHYGEGRIGSRPYLVVDTGGFEPVVKTGIVREMARQTAQAIAESDVVVFVLDARSGLSGQDHDIARFLRRQRKPVVIAVNKAEGMADSPRLAEFHELGLGPWQPVSAAHGDGVAELVEAALARLPAPAPDPQPEEPVANDDGQVRHPLKLAVIGRPNVGKSTFVNAILGEQRVIAFDQPGTTRDAIAIDFERGGRRYTLVDTAGLRRRGKVFETIEKFSVIKTLQAIDEANVVVLMLDATQDIADQDAHIAGYALEAGRAMVVAVNKWDAVDDYRREQIKLAAQLKLQFLRHFRWHWIAAAKRRGVDAVMQSVEAAHAAAFRKLPTPKLTRVLHDAIAFQQPRRSGTIRPKPRYAHQGGQNPPRIVIHGTALDRLTPTYQRFLEARFREAFDLEGTPLRLELKSSSNPFDPRD